jgi:hypothetical protein
MENKNERTPVLDPILMLLKSRRFWVLIIAAIVDVLIAAVPDLSTSRDVLIAAVTAVAGVVVHGFSMEDAALAQSAKKE